MAFNKIKEYLRNSQAFRTIYAKLLSRENNIKLNGKNNYLDIAEAILKQCSIDIIGDNNFVSIARGCTLQGVKVVLQGENLKLKIGRSVFIGQGSVLWMENRDGLLEIGEYSSLEKVGIAVSEGKQVTLGKDCLVSYEVDIRCSDSHGIFDQQSKQRINHAKDIKIADHVWIGAKSMILKGVTIESGAVVGAGSVVTKSIAANAIAVGNPAKTIKTDILWTRSRNDYLDQ
jgi:acetyltransferase-like isoleucine patch superfamily enzyme